MIYFDMYKLPVETCQYCQHCQTKLGVQDPGTICSTCKDINRLISRFDFNTKKEYW